jgi:hypothetical protein
MITRNNMASLYPLNFAHFNARKYRFSCWELAGRYRASTSEGIYMPSPTGIPSATSGASDALTEAITSSKVGRSAHTSEGSKAAQCGSAGVAFSRAYFL